MQKWYTSPLNTNTLPCCLSDTLKVGAVLVSCRQHGRYQYIISAVITWHHTWPLGQVIVEPSVGYQASPTVLSSLYYPTSRHTSGLRDKLSQGQGMDIWPGTGNGHMARGGHRSNQNLPQLSPHEGGYV